MQRVYPLIEAVFHYAENNINAAQRSVQER